MDRPVMKLVLVLMCAATALYAQTPAANPPQAAQPAAPPPANQTNLGSDANGNPLRRALRTGHVSNYDETKVAPYTLPDPLVMANGQPVRTAAMWRQRRAEIVKLYEDEIYGRVPANAPTVTWDVIETDPKAREGASLMKRIVGRVGASADGPRLNLTVHTPAASKGPVPMILLVNFGGGARAGGARGAAPAGGRAGRGPGGGDPPVAAEILARGWGYATIGYGDIQPDRANAWTEGVIGQTLAPGQTAPAPGEWGTISAWAWGVSRIIDYLETDPQVDGRRIAVHGFSRLGKTVLWASAKDERIAAVFSGCSGEMGASLARRDWGETVDDMAQNFAWQFAGNLQKYVGRWNDMPVDAHMLIALSAPRPVFITGGTRDQWADPKGEFLAEVAAGPVYRLLGRQDLGVTEFPPVDTPVIGGDLGWYYHTGGHQVVPAEWQAFLEFAGRHLQ